ncbi:MAG: tRNA (adenosine(37)-N6)-threonylcarbamoyltransferase complex dimerization subunit type 1 TsaB [Bacteroidales bacterium]|nr:tRNA (adenosine(37)-N6)-threonylcarbamoyltransferase complex dimerization subunit type 1 TsaB [Bacteroidales bacterium]
MPVFLCIETASEICSVAIADQQGVISIKESVRKNSHAEVVTVFIDSLMKENHLSVKDLDAVVVSKGPGSYTGLRIGVSTAKGLCYAGDIPLIAINTLSSMASGMIAGLHDRNTTNHLFCPMIDARRMEVYDALFDGEGKMVRETKAEIIDENSFFEYLEKHLVVFFGNGSDKCRGTIAHPNAIFIDHINPSAAFLVKPALEAYMAKNYEDTAYFEPFYLKDFIAGIPRVKGLE